MELHIIIINGEACVFIVRSNMNVVLCSLVNLRLRAQEVQSIEVESRVGITFPLGDYFNGNTSIGPSLGLELRYNVPKSSWDCGLALNVTTAVRKYYLHDSTFYEQSNRSVNVVLFGDYNFGQARKFNPYVGCGVGISLYDAVNEVVYDAQGLSFAFQPRFGVELFRHLRFGVSFLVNRKGYNNVEFSLGLVLGGRPKKSKSIISN